MNIQANGLQIEVEDSGGPGEPVLLIMGLGGQLIFWDEGFVRALTEAGYRVLRFDNRDTGQSQHLPGRGSVPLAAAGLRRLFGFTPRLPYTLHDMANDALGVLDALGIARAHVVGISLGGMVAQRLAIAAPQRCATLTSIMSSSGAPGLPGPRPHVYKAMAGKPLGKDPEVVARHTLDIFRAVSGPAFPVPPQFHDLVMRTIQRGYNPDGNLRQIAAVIADTSRADELVRVRCPTLVLHGEDDPLVRIECGRDTARRIEGARFVAIPGGGHDLAPRAFEEFARHLLLFLRAHPFAAADAQPLQAGALGQRSRYVDQYDPSLLFPVARAPLRQQIGIAGEPRFLGADLWTAFELSWLNLRGKPQIAIAHIVVPCESTHLIESKSFKLYLNSFSGTRMADVSEVRQRIRDDVSAALWHGGEVRATAGVRLIAPEDFDREPLHELDGLNLDRLDLDCDVHGQPAPELLTAAFDEQPVQEVLTSRLLKSNCPVTGQPDWASVQIAYTGPQIDQAGLLRYIVSFRQHNDFHEHCVERIFTDLWARCRPAKLSVYARYTRRGGLDINPWRTSHPGPLPANARTARQ
jgi:7-cyano-7-deazaguanine reductase